MFEQVLSYWQQGRFYQRLNQYPLKTNHLSALHALTPENSDVGEALIAPFVFENASGDKIIPLWLPAVLLENGIGCQTAALPFIPGHYFDPMGPCPIFQASLTDWDTSLRFEWMACDQTTDWELWAQQAINWLENNGGHWREAIAAKGYFLCEGRFYLKMPETSDLSPNLLQQNFATFSDEDGLDPHEPASHSIEEQLLALAPGSWMTLPFTRGDPKQMASILAIRRLYLSQDITCLWLHFDARQGFILWQMVTDESVKWEPLHQMRACDVLLITEAERISASQLFRYLGKASRAIWMGDPHAMGASPLWGGFQESHNLAAFDLGADHLEESLHYRGMQVATGSSLQVAMTHPHFGCEFIPETRDVSMQFVSKPGSVQSLLSERCNPEQAEGLVDWLKARITTGDMQVDAVHIVTLFSAQQTCLRQALEAANVSVGVFTVSTLPPKRVDHMIFSTVYTKDQPRPYLLDVGDILWAQLQAATGQCLWVVGDTRIFDPKCHSPTGLLAKRWLTDEVMSS